MVDPTKARWRTRTLARKPHEFPQGSFLKFLSMGGMERFTPKSQGLPYLPLSLSLSLSLIAFSRSSAGSTMAVPSQKCYWLSSLQDRNMQMSEVARRQAISLQCVVRLAAPPFLHGTASAVCRPLQEQKLILLSLAPSWTSNPAICGRPGGQFEKTLPLPNQQ